MADDLGEEWWVQDKTHSGGEDIASSDDEKLPKKRKVEDLPGASPDEPPKKKKKKKKLNITEALKKENAKAGGPGDVIAALDKHFKDKLSPVEEDELQLEDSNFLESNTLTQSPADYLITILPKWKKQIQKLDKPGSPLLLIITSAAIRSVDLKRNIGCFLGDKCKTAKLFAKHCKMKQHEQYLGKTTIHCGIGTPNRIKALLDSGSLKASHLHYIVFDWNWRDEKQRRLIDIPEVRNDLMQLLQKYFIPHVREGQGKFGLI